MEIKKKINSFRRSIMKSLTKNIGKTNYKIKGEKEVEIKKILISRPNHRLGNLLLLTPLIQEVIMTFPNCKIDLFVKGNVASVIFQNYENIDNIIILPKKPFSDILKYSKGWLMLRNRKYDLSINAIQNSSSGKLSTQFSKSTYKFFGEFNENYETKYSDYRHNAKYPIYNLRSYLTQLGFDKNESQIPFLNLKLDNKEIENGNKTLSAIVPKSDKTICLFTNATGNKCYNEEWWNDFYENIKTAFPKHNIVELLPIENISKLGFIIPTFYSKDIREMGAFIANTSIFIAADSGVMHLASAVGIPTIGLFSVTNENIYKPYNDKSISINTSKVSQKEMFDLINKHINIVLHK